MKETVKQAGVPLREGRDANVVHSKQTKNAVYVHLQHQTREWRPEFLAMLVSPFFEHSRASFFRHPTDLFQISDMRNTESQIFLVASRLLSLSPILTWHSLESPVIYDAIRLPQDVSINKWFHTSKTGNNNAFFVITDCYKAHLLCFEGSPSTEQLPFYFLIP